MSGVTTRTRRSIDWRSPFARLAVSHLLTVSGETLVAVSLAGSLFFKVDPAQGREKVVLGLLFTMAPFAVVGPLIGPFVDRVRGGPRMVIRLTMALRVLVAVALTIALANDSIALFFEAFAMLVLAKTYQIAKAALVPSTVADDLELVEANSKLQLVSGLAAIVAGGVGWVFLQIGAAWVGALTAVTFAAAFVASTRLGVGQPTAEPAAQPPAEVTAPDAIEGHSDVASDVSSDVLVTAWVMAVLRVIVGFSTFMLAFDLRGEAARLGPVDFAVNKTVQVFAQNPFVKVHSLVPAPPPSWYFGVVLAASVVGGMVGAALAPWLRRVVAERYMLVGSCLMAALGGVVGVLADGLIVYGAVALGVATGAALGKQAFDSVVQAEVEERLLGSVFSRFEARFQIVWVVGALVPSLIRIPIPFGSAVVVVLASVGAVVMFTGVRPRPMRTVNRRRAKGSPRVGGADQESRSG